MDLSKDAIRLLVIECLPAHFELNSNVSSAEIFHNKFKETIFYCIILYISRHKVNWEWCFLLKAMHATVTLPTYVTITQGKDNDKEDASI